MTATLRLAERLWNLGDRRAERYGNLLVLCATNQTGWRCKQAALCPRCGRRAAIAERKAIEVDTAAWTGARYLVTRTVAPTGSIDDDRRALLAARGAQQRHQAWRSVFVFARGRIDVAFGTSGPFVHSHELALSCGEVNGAALVHSWRSLLGAGGCSGFMDLRRVEVAPRQRSFRPGRPLLHASATIRTGRDVGRRPAPLAARRPRRSHGRPLRASPSMIAARGIA